MTRVKPPRLILICCEGNTEAAYFRIICRLFRIREGRTKILAEKGQHKAIIDQAVNERNKLIEKEDFGEDEIVCWAICDDDNMTYPFSELKKYAADNNIYLGFSRPQFEAYLLQHFEQSGESNKDALLQKLADYKALHDGVKPYGSSTKADLGWLRDAIDKSPSIVDMAITNSEQRTKSSKPIFFTVHELTRMLMELKLQ